MTDPDQQDRPAEPTNEAFAARLEEERGEQPRFRPPTEISQEPVELAVAEERAAAEQAAGDVAPAAPGDPA